MCFLTTIPRKIFVAHFAGRFLRLCKPIDNFGSIKKLSVIQYALQDPLFHQISKAFFGHFKRLIEINLNENKKTFDGLRNNLGDLISIQSKNE